MLKRKAVADAEGGRGMRPDEMLSLDAQAVLAMVDVGKTWSYLRSDISTYFAQQEITDLKACEREK